MCFPWWNLNHNSWTFWHDEELIVFRPKVGELQIWPTSSPSKQTKMYTIIIYIGNWYFQALNSLGTEFSLIVGANVYQERYTYLVTLCTKIITSICLNILIKELLHPFWKVKNSQPLVDLIAYIEAAER